MELELGFAKMPHCQGLAVGVALDLVSRLFPTGSMTTLHTQHHLRTHQISELWSPLYIRNSTLHRLHTHIYTWKRNFCNANNHTYAH